MMEIVTISLEELKKLLKAKWKLRKIKRIENNCFESIANISEKINITKDFNKKLDLYFASNATMCVALNAIREICKDI